MFLTAAQAIQKLQAGDIVGIPTETVYGLAGRIDSESAIQKIFQVKQRPFFDPLIVHIFSSAEAKKLVLHWPKLAQVLADHFWPGPLTMILPKSDKVSGLITSGLETVALRVPKHRLALEILEQIKIPLAAPSANIFGQTSPTLASHVESEFGGLVGVVDGGPCEVGVESTVLLIQGESEISILRDGMITLSQIEKVLSEASVRWSVAKEVSKKLSPGHMKHHYMPSVPMVILIRRPRDQKHLEEVILNEIDKLPQEIDGVQLRRPSKLNNIVELKLSADPAMAARELYLKLRSCAEARPDLIVFVKPDYVQGEAWSAVWNRISKAASLILDKELE